MAANIIIVTNKGFYQGVEYCKQRQVKKHIFTQNNHEAKLWNLKAAKKAEKESGLQMFFFYPFKEKYVYKWIVEEAYESKIYNPRKIKIALKLGDKYVSKPHYYDSEREALKVAIIKNKERIEKLNNLILLQQEKKDEINNGDQK